MSYKIALVGPAGCGKSTIAKAMQAHGWSCRSFAGPLKYLINCWFGMPYQYTDNPAYKNQVYEPLGVSYRQLAQKLGTEIFRTALHNELPNLKLTGGSFWIHLFDNHMATAESLGNKKIVVDDLRFMDEYHYLKSQGFKVFKLARQGAGSGLIGDTANHISEAGVPYDHEIDNNDEPAKTIEAIFQLLPPESHHLPQSPGSADQE